MAKKVSSIGAIVCIVTIAHSQWKSLVTMADLSNGHISEHVGESHLSVDTSCKAHGVCMQQPYRPGRTCLLDQLA